MRDGVTWWFIFANFPPGEWEEEDDWVWEDEVLSDSDEQGSWEWEYVDDRNTQQGTCVADCSVLHLLFDPFNFGFWIWFWYMFFINIA